MYLLNFLLVFIISMNYSYANTNVDCQSLFNHFVTSKENIQTIIELKNLPPEETILKIDEDLGLRVFNKTRDQFLSNLEKPINEASFEVLISKLNKEKTINKLQNSDEFYQEILIDMKAKRKYAAILRSVFIVFSKKHESPKNFETFTKQFGKMNDALEFKAWNTLPFAAKKLKESYELKIILKELDQFRNSKQSNVIRNLQEIKDEILRLLDKKELSVDEFHETRKLMKHYLTTIQMMVLVDEKKELLTSFNFLNELNDTLGGLRDEVLKDEINKSLSGKKLKVQEIEVIPENLKTNMRTFFNGLVFEE